MLLADGYGAWHPITKRRDKDDTWNSPKWNSPECGRSLHLNTDVPTHSGWMQCRLIFTVLLLAAHGSAASGCYKQQALKRTEADLQMQFSKLHSTIDYKQDAPFDIQDHMEVTLSGLELPNTSDTPVSAVPARRTWKSGEALAFPAASRNPLHALLLQQLGQQHPADGSALFRDPG